MKKLIVSVAVAIVSVALNAASFTWGFAAEDYTDHNGETLTSGSVFLYLGMVTANDKAFDIGSAVLIANGGYDADFNVYGNVDDSNLTFSDKLASIEEGQIYTLILTETAADKLDGYNGYYAIANGESADGVIAGTTPVHYADFTNWDPVQTTSLMQNVPEPTSGLLLLLGMAGLALRRKQA